MSAERAKYLYHSDTMGLDYRVLLPVWLGSYASNVFGFAADDATKQTLPRYVKKRYVTAFDATTGRSRRVFCGTTSCSGWTSVALSVTLPTISGTLEVFVTGGQVGEKRRNI